MHHFKTDVDLAINLEEGLRLLFLQEIGVGRVKIFTYYMLLHLKKYCFTNVFFVHRVLL